MRFVQYLRCLIGIIHREALRWINQRTRFVSALVRPLVWLGLFAAGFRFVLGISIIEPYDTYIPYEVYIAPGLVAMIQMFNGMQSSLSMVYDREMGSMKTLMISPFPRWFLLLAKLLAGTAVSVVQVYMFFVIARLWEVEDDLRDCERRGDFGVAFVELARSVYRLNDRRARLKREINEWLGSRWIEEKSYRAY